MSTRSPFQARAAAWLAIAAVIVGFVLAPPGGGPSLPAGATARLVEGRIEQLTPAGWRPVAIGEVIAHGTEVRTPDEIAVLEIEGGRLEIARGSLATLDMTIELDSGGVLFAVDLQRTVHVHFTEVVGRGTWRVDAGVAPRVGVYDGGAAATIIDADAPANAPVAQLQQVELVDGVPADSVLPLRYFFADPWDQRLLADAIAVDAQVERLETAWEAAYGTAPRAPAFFDDFVAVDEQLGAALAEFATDVDGDALGPPADVLVAIVVVSLLRDTVGLDAGDAIEQVTSLRRLDATWGLILAHHDLGPAALAAAADAALRSRATAVATSPNPTTAPTPSPTPSPTSPGPSPSPSPSPSPTPSPGPSPSPGPPPSPSPSPGPLDELLEPLPDPIEDPLDELLDPVEDPLDELLDPIEDVVPLPLAPLTLR